jgi:HTH-type transcriptional regulator/antitoxin HigA
VIQNEREYKVTREKLAMLAESLAEAQARPSPDLPEVIHQAGLNGIRLLMNDLESEIAEYETREESQSSSLPLNSVLDELPTALSRARLARGWTQKELAQALGVSEQQVQKDERGGYEKASLARLRRVAEALGLLVTGEARLAPQDGAPAATRETGAARRQ